MWCQSVIDGCGLLGLAFGVTFLLAPILALSVRRGRILQMQFDEWVARRPSRFARDFLGGGLFALLLIWIYAVLAIFVGYWLLSASGCS